MRNGADDAMMAAAGVAVTSASCANAAANCFADSAISVMNEPISGFAKFVTFLALPVGVLVGLGLNVLGASFELSFGVGTPVCSFAWIIMVGKYAKRVDG